MERINTKTKVPDIEPYVGKHHGKVAVHQYDLQGHYLQTF